MIADRIITFLDGLSSEERIQAATGTPTEVRGLVSPLVAARRAATGPGTACCPASRAASAASSSVAPCQQTVGRSHSSVCRGAELRYAHATGVGRRS